MKGPGARTSNPPPALGWHHQSAAPMSPVNQALDRDGYAIVPGVLDERWVECLRRAFDHAPVQSGGTQHIELTDETPEVESWRALEHHPVLKVAAEHLLSQPYCLGGLHGRNPLPGFGQQGLHSDCLRGQGDECILITALWMLDDFTLENGATRVVPGSHRITRQLSRDLAQPFAKHRDEKIIVGSAGSVLMFNGYLWHSGRRNDSKGLRRAVQMGIRSGTAESPAALFAYRNESA
jgi:ectoine hydroxylase-related dioxygenase (phytanoyl-CoA dioxygenase family)